VTDSPTADTTAPLQRALASIKELRRRVEATEAARMEPIAIIGMGCRLPGADDPRAFWQLLRTGGDAITETPIDRWNVDTLYDGDPEAAGKVATRWGGFLRNIDQFDAAFFGISPREAAQMDPQQRLLLEVAWETLDDAGQDADTLSGGDAGVFVGVHSHSADYYALQASDPQRLDVYSGTGTSHSVVSGRLSYFLDWRGPSLAVDTACSSSLVAVHLAVQSLRRRECSLALVGGVNTIIDPTFTMVASRMRMMSPTGRCRPFDAGADGFVRSEGCGAVLLKRLSDAIAAGDRIHAVIKGSAVNQDGRSNGLTAPNGVSQEAVIRAALADAGLPPSAIGLLEAHGTGTPLGDPIELGALSAVFGGDDAPSSCALGSVKANIGHTEGAAGVAALIKTVLTLRAGEIPPLVHFETLNPHVSLAGTPLVIPTAPQSWPASSTPRYAGVSSFGWSGTNAHVVVGEPPPVAPVATDGVVRPLLLPISARDDGALRDLAAAYHTTLIGAAPAAAGALCATAALRRTHHDHRLAVTGTGRDELVAELDAFLAGQDSPGLAIGRARGQRDQLVFVFPGQGSQWPGMGRQLLAAEPVFRESVERADAAVRSFVDWSLVDVLTGRDPAALERIEVVQPALFAIEVALATLWQRCGVAPAAVVGHSVGEVAAAHVAGILSLDDAARIICTRSQLLRRIRGRGEMAMVELGLDHARGVIAGYEDRIAVAVSNSVTSTVLSGDPGALGEVLAGLEHEGVFCRRVKVDVASHSPQVDDLCGDLVTALAGIRPLPARVPFVSTVTATYTDGPDLDGAYWASNLRQPVLFADAIARLVATGHGRFVELSPHPLLLAAIRETLDQAGRGGVAVPSLRRNADELVSLHASLGALHVDGHALDWSRLYERRPATAELPPYPWQRERHWLDGDRRGEVAPARDRTDPLLGWPLSLAGDASPVVWENHFDPRRDPELFEHVIGGVPSVAASVLVELMRRASDESDPAARLTDVRFERPLTLNGAEPTVVQTVRAGTAIAVHRRVGTEWVCTATAALGAASAAPVHADLALLDRLRSSGSARAGAELYDGLLAAGVEIGPSRRGVVTIWSMGDHHVADIVVSTAETSLAALDAAVQVSALATGSPLVPLSARSMEIRVGRLPPARMTATVTFVPLAADATTAIREADVVVYGNDGDVLVTVQGLRLQPIGALVGGVDDGCYGVEWRAAPAATSSINDASIWLLVGGPSDITDAVAVELEAAGRRCRVSDDIDAFDHATGIVYLGALAVAEPRNAAELEAALLEACGGLVDLMQRLVRARGNARVWVVTQGVHRIGDDDSVAVAQAPLWGLGRAIAEELPERWGGLVDLEPGVAPAAAARSLAHELVSDGDGEREVAYRGDGRFVPRLVRRPVGPRPSVPISPHGTYLITGGFGALGQQVAAWLVARGARRVLLVGRTELPPRSSWSTVAADSPAGRRIAVVRRLEAAGAAVHVGAVDVGDAEALAMFLDEFRAESWPPIRAVFHAAAAFGGELITDLEPSALRAQLGAKVIGAWALAQQLSDVEQLVLFSSIAALLPIPGQGVYAAGNAFLDAVAAQRAARAQPGLSVGWGLWDGSTAGVGYKEAARVLAASQGVDGFGPECGLAALGWLLGSGRDHVVMAAVDWRRFAAARPARSLPLVSELTADIASPAVAALGGAPLVERCRAVPPAARAELVEASVRRIVCGVLKLAESRLDPTQPFGAFGLDSLMAIELRNRLGTELGVTLSASTAWNYPTLDELTAFVIRCVDPGADTSATVPPAPPEGGGETAGPGTAGLARAVAELSDDDALMALMGGDR
jgi:myxalamid-type polyketide synthase MxaE and MxaD